MKIYFNSSIKQEKEQNDIFQRITSFLKRKNHEILPKSFSEEEQINSIQECDLAIIEGSCPSTIQIGLEIAMILERGKPVIFLYKEGMSPLFINTISSIKLIKSEY